MSTLRLIIDIRTKRNLSTYGVEEINIHAKGLKRNKNPSYSKKRPNLKLIKGNKNG